MRPIVRLLATLILSAAALSWPGPAEACSCVRPGLPCQEAGRADAVFVGHVVSILLSTGRQVQLAVIEPFRGLQLSQVTLVTGYGGGDCGVGFEIGQTYLVYAHRTRDGQLTTSICSRTRLLGDASEDLAYLRSLAAVNQRMTGRIAGRVVLWEYPVPDGRTLMPMARVVVTATGGGRTFRATTNARGEFEVTRLPLGKYDVIARADGYDATKQSVEILDPRGCGETVLYVQHDGRVMGRVVDSRGASIQGIAIELVLPADVDTPGGRTKKVVARTAADGTFELRRVGPDKYLLGFNSIQGINRLPRAFYPGVTEAADATMVVVATGERVRLQDFVIPETIKLVTINGIVVDETGQPVREATVTLREAMVTSSGSFRNPLGPAINTADDGRFTFSLIENGKYDVHVTRYVGTDLDRTDQVGVVPFIATAGSPFVTVKLKTNQ